MNFPQEVFLAESGCDLYAAYHMLEKNERGQFDIKGLKKKLDDKNRIMVNNL